MKVLFVAFELPPLGTGGVHRSLKFLKYLPEYGVTPIALTTDVESYRARGFYPLDESLITQLSPSLAIERVACPPVYTPNGNKFANWGRQFLALDELHAREWEPQLARELPRILETHSPEAIYVTLPPFGLGRIWSKLAKQYRLPLVFDFRDKWSEWGSAPNPTWFHYKLKVRLEKECLLTAARVVCATEGVRRDLLAAHVGVAPEKLVTITNGYDADITEWPTELKRDTQKEDFVVGYLGSFYYTPEMRQAMMLPWWRKPPLRMLHYAPNREDWLYRTPYFFFRTVKTLLSKRPELKARIKIRFACVKPDWLDSQIEEFGLSDIVECLGYVEHDQVPQFLSQCDCLLATSVKVIDGADYCIAGKTFDYFGAKKPILGFVTEGTQKDTLVKSGMSVICDPDDPDASAEKIEQWLAGEVKLTPNTPFLQRFHRRELTRQLADLLLSLKTERMRIT